MSRAPYRPLVLVALLAAAGCAPAPPPHRFGGPGHGPYAGGPPPGGGFKAAGQRFLLLDTAHRGALTLDTLPPLPERGGRGRGLPGGGATAPDAP